MGPLTSGFREGRNNKNCSLLPLRLFSFRSQEKGKNSDFLGGGVGDRKLIKDRLRIRTVRGTFKEEVR